MGVFINWLNGFTGKKNLAHRLITIFFLNVGFSKNIFGIRPPSLFFSSGLMEIVCHGYYICCHDSYICLSWLLYLFGMTLRSGFNGFFLSVLHGSGYFFEIWKLLNGHILKGPSNMLPIFSAMVYFALLARKWPFYKDIYVFLFYEIFVFSSKYRNLRKVYFKKSGKTKQKKI